MKKSKIYLLLIFVASLFMSIGYATINGITLDLNGDVTASIPKEVLITNVNGGSGTNVNLYYQTTLSSDVTLSTTNINSTVPMNITIYNNTNINKYFDTVKYTSGGSTYSNSNIDFELTNITQGYMLAPGDSVTFTITFKYSDSYKTSATAPYTNTLSSYLNFNFTDTSSYSVTYTGIDNTSSLPSSVTPNGTLTANFGSGKYHIDGITMGGTALSSSSYSFSNNILTINNVTGNIVVTVSDVSDYAFVIDNDVNELTTPEINANTTINELLSLTFDGVNFSDSPITSIIVTMTYTSPKGANQSVNITLKNNTTGQTQTTAEPVLFKGKTSSPTDISITFNNVTINNGDTFTLSTAQASVNNLSVSITSYKIKIFH